MRNAHRVAWELFKGESPGKLFVCHKCDNPKCVNPDHLFLGTHLDNMRDREIKGRTNGQRGEGNASHKLTTDQVRAIRAEAAKGVATKQLASRFGISPSTATKVIERRAWKHIA
jgi:DNA-binding NarL/FixJ family response regulator